MKKFLTKIIQFSVFASVFYIIILPLWSYIMPPFMAKNVRSCVGCYGHLFSRVKEIPQVKNPDILFIGSSHAYRGFDPRVFSKYGLNTFNLGSSSQTPINMQVLLKQYLDDIQPKMVIMETYAGTLETDGVESSLDLLSNNKIDKNALQMAVKINQLPTYNTLLYGYFRQVFGLNKSFTEPAIQDGNTYIKGGFVESKFSKNQLKEEQIKDWDINPDQLNALKENIALLKQRNIPYILVQAPITKKLYDARTNNKEVDSLLSTLGTYKNFYDTIKLNDTLDFYDSNHLNQNAVVKFNEKVIEYLKTTK